MVMVLSLALLEWGAASGSAMASGYALREQSTVAFGNAFAGSAAAAEDPSFMFFNPAGLTRLPGNQVVVGGSMVMPDSHFKNGEASTARGVGLSGGDGGNDVASDALVPVFYAQWDIQQTFDLDENVKFGLGVNVPFGLESDYANGWMGRYYALHSRLSSISINPVVAYEVIDGLSIAAGPQFQYTDARLTNAIDFGSIAQASGPPLSRLARPGQQDGRSTVDGDDWGYGYSLGVLYEPWKGTRFGAAFRSSIDHNLRGNADFRLDSAGVGQLISARTGAFTNTGAQAKIETPWAATFGFYHELDDQWALMGTVERTGWSAFKDLTVKFANPAQPDSVTDNSWNDSWFGALGVTYRPREDWTLRCGGAWDESPTPSGKATPRIPADGRAWLAFGVGYRPLPNVAIDFGYAHLFLPDTKINLTASQEGNAFRGNLSGDAETSIDMISLQGRVSF